MPRPLRRSPLAALRRCRCALRSRSRRRGRATTRRREPPRPRRPTSSSPDPHPSPVALDVRQPTTRPTAAPPGPRAGRPRSRRPSPRGRPARLVAGARLGRRHRHPRRRLDPLGGRGRHPGRARGPGRASTGVARRPAASRIADTLLDGRWAVVVLQDRQETRPASATVVDLRSGARRSPSTAPRPCRPSTAAPGRSARATCCTPRSDRRRLLHRLGRPGDADAERSAGAPRTATASTPPGSRRPATRC